MHGHEERLRGGQTWRESTVDQEAPDVAVAHAADELFDVDAAIAQCRTFPIWFCDLALEGDDALKSWLENRLVNHLGSSVVRRLVGERGCVRRSALDPAVGCRPFIVVLAGRNPYGGHRQRHP